jgi:hypothetical protein
VTARWTSCGQDDNPRGQGAGDEGEIDVASMNDSGWELVAGPECYEFPFLLIFLSLLAKQVGEHQLLRFILVARDDHSSLNWCVLHARVRPRGGEFDGLQLAVLGLEHLVATGEAVCRHIVCGLRMAALFEVARPVKFVVRPATSAPAEAGLRGRSRIA